MSSDKDYFGIEEELSLIDQQYFQHGQSQTTEKLTSPATVAPASPSLPDKQHPTEDDPVLTPQSFITFRERKLKSKPLGTPAAVSPPPDNELGFIDSQMFESQTQPARGAAGRILQAPVEHSLDAEKYTKRVRKEKPTHQSDWNSHRQSDSEFNSIDSEVFEKLEQQLRGRGGKMASKRLSKPVAALSSDREKNAESFGKETNIHFNLNSRGHPPNNEFSFSDSEIVESQEQPPRETGKVASQRFPRPVEPASDAEKFAKGRQPDDNELNFIDSQIFGNQNQSPAEEADTASASTRAPKRPSKPVEPLSEAQKYAESFRKEKGINFELNPRRSPAIVDSLGFRVPRDRKFDIDRMSKEDVAHLLHKLVICDKDDIIALNKPYGLPAQGTSSDEHSLVELLPRLTERLKLSEPLHMVHRLDKETTGVILLAKTPAMAHLLREGFKKHEIMKSYVCITVGVPNPMEGVVNIPLKKVQINGKFRMMLRPKYNSGDNHLFESVMHHYGHAGAQEALTYYNVLDSNRGVALVQCKPITGVTHQIRAHFSQALEVPIFGDHKYSHKDRALPQLLPNFMLKRLHVRQSKVRYFPMHLHAHTIQMGPSAGSPVSGQYQSLHTNSVPLPDFYVTAPLPEFFFKNLRYLQLNWPKTMSMLRSHIL